MNLIDRLSTRQIAEKHGLSQTRVRQIIYRVSNWLAAMLPSKTDAEKDQEARLAQHLAAEQMRSQIETLQNHWDATGNPKYLRAQTRVIASLGRLGIVPGAIDALAADATDGPLDPSEPQPHWSEADPWANSATLARSASEGNAASPPNKSSTLVPSATSSTPHSSPPPSRDCSPSDDPQLATASAPQSTSSTTNSPATTSDDHWFPAEDVLHGLNHMERNLLTWIETTPHDDEKRLASLHETLDEVRTAKAKYERRLSSQTPTQLEITPTNPGALLTAMAPDVRISESAEANSKTHPLQA